MPHYGSIVALFGLLASTHSTAGPPGANEKDLQTLQGKWRVVKFLHFDRETTPGEDGDGVIVEFKGRSIDFNRSEKGSVVEIDPSTDPKCLDFKGESERGTFRKGMTYEGVYKLDGDTLTWAVHTGRGKDRPTLFDKPVTAGTMVMRLTRVKE